MTVAAHVAAKSGGGGVRTLTAAAVAAAVGGRLVGDETIEVASIAPLDRAGPGEVSFLASARYAPLFARSRASVVLVAPDLADAEGSVPARVIVDKPHEALLALLPVLYAPPEREAGIHSTAPVPTM